MNSETYEVDVEEVEYVHHADGPMLARVFRPRGRGPFPALVDAHGGAWVLGDRTNNDLINRPVAAGGVVVVSIDYRMPPQATYPGSVADVNYAVRWLKANAARFGTRPDLVALMGTSSGGHLAVLAALKPFDSRYAVLSVEGPQFDARVPYVVAMWPVICPWGRLHDLKQRAERGEAHHADRPGASQDQMRYWLTEEALAEGSPTLALERGDAVELPDILYVQATGDTLHPRVNLDQFVANYRRRGGKLDLHLIEGEPYDLMRKQPDSEETRRALLKIGQFIHEHAG